MASGGADDDESGGFGRAASTAPSYAPTGALVVNGAVADAECSAPANMLLASLPGSAYTTIRTHGGRKRVVQWDAHVARLRRSAEMLDGEAGRDLGWPPGGDWGATVGPSVSLALQVLGTRAAADDGSGEAMVVIIVTPGAPKARITSLAVPLPMPFRHNRVMDGAALASAGEPSVLLGWSMWPTWVDVQVWERGMGGAKVSDWVLERRAVEERRPHTCGETVLSDAKGKVGEGCLTNLFVVHADRYVQTAPCDGSLLDGTMRQLVLQACRDIGIEVREERPDAAGAAASRKVVWLEAFLTSAGRVAQPIQGMFLPEATFAQLPDGGRIEFNSITPVSDAIRARVYELMAAEARPLDE